MTNDPLLPRSHNHDADTHELLRVVDRASLRHALDAGIREAEENIADVIAADYADDEDIDEVGEDVIDWELAELREIDGRLQAACLVVVELYRDEGKESSVGTTGGCCWFFVEFAERPWRGAQLTLSRSWPAIERRGPVPWTPAPATEPGPSAAMPGGQMIGRQRTPYRSNAGRFGCRL